MSPPEFSRVACNDAWLSGYGRKAHRDEGRRAHLSPLFGVLEAGWSIMTTRGHCPQGRGKSILLEKLNGEKFKQVSWQNKNYFVELSFNSDITGESC